MKDIADMKVNDITAVACVLFMWFTDPLLDKQIHIAHNVKIGQNSIIAGQVGIAGSSVLGENVRIGGQAGISGHLKIGNNVEIGGGSGVIKDIPDNTKVMGYPAKNIRKCLSENKWYIKLQ